MNHNGVVHVQDTCEDDFELPCRSLQTLNITNMWMFNNNIKVLYIDNNATVTPVRPGVFTISLLFLCYFQKSKNDVSMEYFH
jgi:hypothetical protein